MLQNEILLNQIGSGNSLYDKLTQVASAITTNQAASGITAIPVASDITSNNIQACSELIAFANEVKTQTGKKISESQANFLLQTMVIMQSELNCGG